MITELVVTSLLGLVEALLGLLPEVTLPFTSQLAGFATLIGSQVGAMDSFLPITEALPIVTWALTVYLPFLMVFYTVRWIYSVLPVVGQSS